MTNISRIRETGSFYTPLPFAQLTLEYIEKKLGPNWYKEYKIYDCCCGQGNLEYYIPSYENVYMSTLEQEDIDILKKDKKYKDATIFQYDYLNDDVKNLMWNADKLDDSLNWKLPRNLREDLANPDTKWIILINPPYGEAGAFQNEKKKPFISNTNIKYYMPNKKIGKELYMQFLFRIHKEFPNAYLSLMSSLKYIVSPTVSVFNSGDYKMQFYNGFVFPADAFEGLKKWPVGCILWDLKEKNVDDQLVALDIYDDLGRDLNTSKIIHRTIHPLSKWISKSRNTHIPTVPLKSAIEIAASQKCTKLAKNSVGFMFADGNDVLSGAVSTGVFSGSYGGGKGWSINRLNFEQSVISFAIRRINKQTWINNKDQFIYPVELSFTTEFITDCLIYMLFDSGNHTSSLKDITYKNKQYDIQNHFHPFRSEFMKTYLENKTLSTHAEDVLNIGKKIYALFEDYYSKLDLTKFKIADKLAGWWQIRKALKSHNIGNELFQQLLKLKQRLKIKILMGAYTYGFLFPENIE